MVAAQVHVINHERLVLAYAIGKLPLRRALCSESIK